MTSKMSEKVMAAKLFCQQAHDAIKQVRKYTGEPYWHHPFEVMELVRSVGGSESQLCAALLHDVVEDTGVPLEVIQAQFGDDVASLVEMLTDVSKPEDGNRKARKAIDLQHTALASPEAKTIKLADLISNSRSIADHDPDFAVIYMKEKKALLEVLKDGDATLFAEAKRIIDEYYKNKSKSKVKA